MENWTVKDAGSGENLSAAEREEAVLEPHTEEQPQEEPQGYQTPTNDDGDFVVNLDQPPNLEDNAVQEQEAESVDVGEQAEPSEEVVEEVREEPSEEDFGIELVTDEDDAPAQEAQPEPVVEEQPVVEQPQVVIPEGFENLVEFINETGGTLEDYVNLNRDVTQMNEVDVIKEYYRQTKPHLDADDVQFQMNKKFLYDPEVDDEDTIREKQLAWKEELYKAQNHISQQKDRYYAELKANPRNFDPVVKEAMAFAEEQKAAQENSQKLINKFHKQTEQVFNQDFKGFDFNVGDNKFRVKVNDVKGTMENQKDLNNFINQFIGDDGDIKDVAAYHKALYVARNADKLAQHFYEQGRSDAIKQSAASSKNIDMKPRQDASSIVTPSGTKYKVVSGDSSNKLRIKMNR